MARTMHAYAAWKSNTEAIRACQGVFAQRLSVKNDTFMQDLEGFSN